MEVKRGRRAGMSFFSVQDPRAAGQSIQLGRDFQRLRLVANIEFPLVQFHPTGGEHVHGGTATRLDLRAQGLHGAVAQGQQVLAVKGEVMAQGVEAAEGDADLRAQPQPEGLGLRDRCLQLGGRGRVAAQAFHPVQASGQLELPAEEGVYFRSPSFWYWFTRGELIVLQVGVLLAAAFAVSLPRSRLYLAAMAELERLREDE